MVASPDDVVKKKSVKGLIESHSEFATEAKKQLNDSGIEADEWWESE